MTISKMNFFGLMTSATAIQVGLQSDQTPMDIESQPLADTKKGGLSMKHVLGGAIGGLCIGAAITAGVFVATDNDDDSGGDGGANAAAPSEAYGETYQAWDPYSNTFKAGVTAWANNYADCVPGSNDYHLWCNERCDDDSVRYENDKGECKTCRCYGQEAGDWGRSWRVIRCNEYPETGCTPTSEQQPERDELEGFSGRWGFTREKGNFYGRHKGLCQQSKYRNPHGIIVDGYETFQNECEAIMLEKCFDPTHSEYEPAWCKTACNSIEDQRGSRGPPTFEDTEGETQTLAGYASACEYANWRGLDYCDETDNGPTAVCEPYTLSVCEALPTLSDNCEQCATEGKEASTVDYCKTACANGILPETTCFCTNECAEKEPELPEAKPDDPK